jgi:hypothetical protein
MEGLLHAGDLGVPNVSTVEERQHVWIAMSYN